MAHTVIFSARDVLSLVENLPVDNSPRRINESENGEPSNRFARARFTDQAQHLTGVNRKADIVYRIDDARLW